MNKNPFICHNSHSPGSAEFSFPFQSVYFLAIFSTLGQDRQTTLDLNIQLIAEKRKEAALSTPPRLLNQSSATLPIRKLQKCYGGYGDGMNSQKEGCNAWTLGWTAGELGLRSWLSSLKGTSHVPLFWYTMPHPHFLRPVFHVHPARLVK